MNQGELLWSGDFKYLAPQVLYVDHSFQRDVNRAWVARVAKRFEAKAFGSIIVSSEDARYVVLDGQHRLAVVRARPDLGIEMVPCLDLGPMSQRDKARLFLGLNEERHLTTWGEWRALVIAEDPIALECLKALQQRGLEVGSATSVNRVSAVGALLALERREQGFLGQVLDVSIGAWGHDADGWSRTILNSLGRMMLHYGPALDRDRLVEKLQEILPRRLLAEARADAKDAGSTLATALSRRILASYNRGLRSNRLPPWTGKEKRRRDYGLGLSDSGDWQEYDRG